MKPIWCKRNRVLLLLAVFFSIVTYHFTASAGPNNGFDVSNAIIPASEILAGGPPKDGIPALSDPELIDAEAASYLKPDDRIIGVTMDGISRAYPIAILNWHEIVNDTINGQRYAVTFCPLCGTGVAFYSDIAGSTTDFGVSGLLYNSDVLLYDRETESLWSQIMSQAVAGKLVGEKLKAFPVSHTTWRDWVKQHPDTQVLSTDTGYSRDYSRNPYRGYEQSRQLYFGVNQRAPDTYHPKEQVIGLEIDGVYKAYPFAELEKNNQSQFKDSINGVSITIDWDSENQSVELFDSSGKRIAGIQGFWFAWFAFHPDTLVFKAS
ncbi:MAG: DUF3179 domain-containing protein [Gammaproteobacteria bacterium]